MQHTSIIQPRAWRATCLTGLSAMTLLLVGCASKPAQGYGEAAQQSTAAQAQQQMQSAEQATQVNTAQTYLDLIAQMQQAGQWYASLAHTEAFEQQHGASTQVRLLRADALRNTGQTQQAQQAYTELLSGSDSQMTSRARRGLGLLHASQGQYTLAVEQLELARKLNPIDANVLSDLAYAHMLDGRVAQAQHPILQAAQLAPGNPRVQLNMALYWLATGNQPEARRLLQRLSQRQPKNAPPLIDQDSLQTLQAQLTSIQKTMQDRASASALPIAPMQAQPAQVAAPAPSPTQAPATLQMQTQLLSAHPTLVVQRQTPMPPVPENAADMAPPSTAAEPATHDHPL